MTIVRSICAGLLLISLVGCSHIRAADSTQNYRKFAKITPALQSPPGVSLKKGQDLYPIPRISYAQGQKDVSILPPGSDLTKYQKHPNPKG